MSHTCTSCFTSHGINLQTLDKNGVHSVNPKFKIKSKIVFCRQVRKKEVPWGKNGLIMIDLNSGSDADDIRE